MPTPPKGAEMKHTETPARRWEVKGNGLAICLAEVEAGETTRYMPREEIARMTVDRPEYARHIVHCVNAHDGLVAALRKLDNYAHLIAAAPELVQVIEYALTYEMPPTVRICFDAALRKARGEG